VVVAVMHANGVDLLFVTLDTVGSTDIVSEEPGIGCLFLVNDSTSKH
jgi:hypothetical protein